jgi:succinate-semialdehyde dehydrogenase/glutarate-semialdehyde dehydrogenase
METGNYPDLYLFIGGERRSGGDRRVGKVYNPATGSELATLPHATQSDLDDALAAAATAFNSWKRMPPVERAQILERAADLIRERADAIATILTLEEGKVLSEA